jgi:hypothetical protein
MRVTRHDSCWVPPFGHPRITARLPTPQGLSQAPTSFIGSRCQGIHHAPFIACLTNQQNNHYKDARVHYPDLKQQPHTTPPTPITGTDRHGREPRHHLMPQNPNSAPSPTPAPPRPLCTRTPGPTTGRTADDSTIRTPPTTRTHSVQAQGACSLERR